MPSHSLKLRPAHLHAMACCRRPPVREGMLSTDALAKSFTLHLQGGVRIPVLADVGLDVHAGECVVLSGPSGVGKSTLMRSLYGNYRAQSGHIQIRHHGTMVDLATADPRT